MSVEIVAELKQLKLNGMASCYPELVSQSRPKKGIAITPSLPQMPL